MNFQAWKMELKITWLFRPGKWCNKFHDFSRLENKVIKFHDLPGPYWKACISNAQVLQQKSKSPLKRAKVGLYHELHTKDLWRNGTCFPAHFQVFHHPYKPYLILTSKEAYLMLYQDSKPGFAWHAKFGPKNSMQYMKTVQLLPVVGMVWWWQWRQSW